MKKSLIPISILMSFIGPFASIANVGAITNTDGPWSFDELLSARTEFKTAVDANCPRSSYRSPCVEEFREEMGGAVSHGIMQTEGLQLLPVSIDFSNDTFEYYYSSDNLRRNFDWHLPYKNIYATKLVLIQADADYVKNSGEWTDKIIVSDQNSKWLTLYSEEVAEGEESLLAVNQKATLDIVHPIFDSQHEKAIRGYIEYSTGEYTHFVFTFENTKDGRKYDSWFGMEELYPYFEDPNYNEGYQDGLDDGYNNGYDDGLNDGENNGYENGYTNGYEHGYNAGYQEGFDTGNTEGYENGICDGTNTGYQEGYYEGLGQGYEDGLSDGTNTGYQEGFNDGYTQGFLDGQNESTSEIASGSNSTPDDTPTSGDDLVEEQSTIQNDNSLNQSISNTINNNLTLESNNITTNSALKKPNTGASTAENGSTEAEWWIGAILALGLFTLAWLFWPNRQKSPKNSSKTLDKKGILR